jgi:hypothetical protein
MTITKFSCIVGLFFMPTNHATTIAIGAVVAVFVGGVKMLYNDYVADTTAKILVGGYGIRMNTDYVMDYSSNINECRASMANSNRCCGSHQPNTEMNFEFIAGTWIAWLESISVIAYGEEITHDYGDPFAMRAAGVITTKEFLRQVESDDELDLHLPCASIDDHARADDTSIVLNEHEGNNPTDESKVASLLQQNHADLHYSTQENRADNKTCFLHPPTTSDDQAHANDNSVVLNEHEGRKPTDTQENHEEKKLELIVDAVVTAGTVNFNNKKQKGHVAKNGAALSKGAFQLMASKNKGVWCMLHYCMLIATACVFMMFLTQ